jgi:hypothetical protein
VKGQQKSAAYHAYLGALLASLTACSGIPFHTSDGTTHYLVVGVGVVSTKEQLGVSVMDSRGAGLLAGPAACNAGLFQQHYLEIDPRQASNVVISIQARPLSLTVKNFDSSAAPSNNVVLPIAGERANHE